MIHKNYGSLRSIFQDSIEGIAAEMLQAGVKTMFVVQNPTFEKIINSFLSKFPFAKEIRKIEVICTNFFSVFYKIGGPFTDAADTITEDIQRTVREKLNIELNI